MFGRPPTDEQLRLQVVCDHYEEIMAASEEAAARDPFLALVTVIAEPEGEDAELVTEVLGVAPTKLPSGMLLAVVPVAHLVPALAKRYPKLATDVAELVPAGAARVVCFAMGAANYSTLSRPPWHRSLPNA